jgi:hypothetical protein
MTEEEMYRLSDEELEKMFYDAKAEGQSPDVGDEDLEQPVEASDDNGTEEIELDDEAEEPAEVEESDEIAEAEEEPTEAEEEEEIAEVQEVQKVKFKANGKEYEFTEDEIKAQFPKIFGQAMDYTKKTQAIKPWRKTIDAIEQAKLSHDDVNLMIDVLRGDKDAIAAVMKRTGIDALELDTENSKYVPKDYGRDDNALAIKDVIDEISADKEYEITHKVLSKDWDDNSFREMTKDPELIKQLHIDVKTGMFDKVQPIAEKMKVFDRGRQSDLDYYKMAAVEYFREQEDVQRRMEAVEQQRLAREAKLAKQAEVEKVREAQTKREKVVEKTEQRKAAAPTKSNAGTKKVVDYLDDSDEAYEEWYKQMEAKR